MEPSRREDGNHDLRKGVHIDRFSPYIAALEPSYNFLKTEDIKPRTCAEIDVAALLENTKHIISVASEYGNETMAVIKSDAYGHGAVIVARLLNKYRGINFFGIATLTEALELRAGGLTDVRILVLGPIHQSEWSVCAAAHIELVLDSADMVELLLEWGANTQRKNPTFFENPENHLKMHVYLNTGMNRIGLCTFDSSTETHGKKNPTAPSSANSGGGGGGGGFESVSSIFDQPPPDMNHNQEEEEVKLPSPCSSYETENNILLSSLSMTGTGAKPPRLSTNNYTNHYSFRSGGGNSMKSPSSFNNNDSVNSTTSLNSGGSVNGSTNSVNGFVLAEVKDTVMSIGRLAREGANVGIKFEGICTHMCDAESRSDYTMRQLGRLKQVVKGLRQADIEIPCIHVANSEALLSRIIDKKQWRRIVGTSKSYCRIGGALYGLRRFKELVPVLTLKAQVRYVGLCEEGMTVGYDRTWIAPRDCLVATLSIGFGDGYTRRFSNNGEVGVRNMMFPIAGTICMDMTMVDLGPSDGPGAAVKVGDYVTLYGLGGHSLAKTSKHIRTCQSDLCCHLSRRIARRYVNIPDEVDQSIFQLYGPGTTQYDRYCV